MLLDKPEGRWVVGYAGPHLPAQVDARSGLSYRGVEHLERVARAEPSAQEGDGVRGTVLFERAPWHEGAEPDVRIEAGFQYGEIAPGERA